MKQLTKKEEELMRKLWDKDEVTGRELVEAYPEPRPHFNTVATVLKVLERKGWVKHRLIGNTNLYKAAVTEEEYGKKSISSIISDFFNGSLTGMISSLLKDRKLSDREIKELIDIMENKDNKEK